jgi:acetyl esterase/lipase
MMTTSPHVVSYGPHPDQVGDLYLPGDLTLPLVILLHGGFWRMPHGRGEFDAVACALNDRGYGVWNLEYRRVGEEGGGWPGTGEDILAAIDAVPELAASGVRAKGVVLVGFSAGGHLALWAARERTGLAGVAALAPISDLHQGAALGLGRGAVREFLGGLPKEWSEEFARANPIERGQAAVPEVVIHGVEDDVVPVGMSRRYAALTGASLIAVPEEGHGAHLDPGSRSHRELVEWLRVAPNPHRG